MMEPTAPRKPRLSMQIGLRHLLIATMAIAAWTAHFINTNAISFLTPKLDRLRKIGRELVVEDPARIAIVCLDQDIDIPLHWEVYIPNDDYELFLATQEIDAGKYPTQCLRKRLEPGRFRLIVRETEIENGYAITVLRNNEEILRINESSDWRTSTSQFSSGTGQYSQQFDGNVPIDIHRKRFNVPIPGSPNSTTSPTGPSNGVLLWIQKRP